MSRALKLLLHLYPAGWRQRYGAEMEEMLEAERVTLRSAADLIAGAIDARRNPQLPHLALSRGGIMGTKMFRCAAVGVNREDQMRAAAWMIGGSLLFAGIAVTLQLAIGSNTFSEALLYAAFPAALMLSNECTWLKTYSPAARLLMAGGGAILVIAVTWLSVVLAYLI